MFTIVGSAVNHCPDATWTYGAAKCFVGNTLILFGGLINGEPIDTLQAYTVATDNPHIQPDANGALKLHIQPISANCLPHKENPKPPARYGATLTPMSPWQKCILIGGHDGHGHVFSDVWLLDPVSFVWESVPIWPEQESARFMHKSVVLSDGNVLVLGGYSSSSSSQVSPKALPWDHDFASAWVLNVSSWTWQAVCLAVPPATSCFFPFPVGSEKPSSTGWQSDEANLLIQNYHTKEFEWWSEQLTEQSLASLHVREKRVCKAMLVLGRYIMCMASSPEKEEGDKYDETRNVDLCRNLAIYDAINKQKVNNVDFVFDSLDVIHWDNQQRDSLVALDTRLRFPTESDFLYPVTLGLWISMNPKESYVTTYFHSKQKQAFFEAMVRVRGCREEAEEVESSSGFWRSCPAPLVTCVLDFL